jgi:hypothetical protein
LEMGFDNVLASPNASYADLALEFSPVHQCDVQKYDPVACHREVYVAFVAAWFGFFRVAHHGAHARMRHVRLNCDVRRWERLPIGIFQSNRDCRGSNLRGSRLNFVLYDDSTGNLLHTRRFRAPTNRQARKRSDKDCAMPHPSQPDRAMLLRPSRPPAPCATRRCTLIAPVLRLWETCGSTCR